MKNKFLRAWKIVCKVAKGSNYHIISDSYSRGQSIKKCEIIKISEAEPVEITNLEINPPISPKMESFANVLYCKI